MNTAWRSEVDPKERKKLLALAEGGSPDSCNNLRH